MSYDTSAPAWWVIREDALLKALCTVADGDDPGIVMTELLANSKTREVPPSAE